MPYLGNPAVDRFTATKAASVYSGNGSTTAFTLEHSVGADEDILVSVDGVIQEPSVAYAVSSGTTLTFTAAPSSNSGNNIFVYYLFRTIGTVTHPPTSALSATSGTFTGAFTSLGIDDNADATALTIADTETVAIGGTTITDLNLLNLIGNTGSRNVGITFNKTNSTAQIWGMQNAGDLVIYNYTDSFQAMNIDEIGAVTLPKQPAFSVNKGGTDQTNMSVGGSATLVTFNTEVFDQNGDFSGNAFTAPVTGKYQLNASLYINAVDSASNYYVLQMITSNRNYQNIFDPDFGQDAGYWTLTVSVLADMDANDTAEIKFFQNNGTAQTDISGSATATFFTGCLLA